MHQSVAVCFVWCLPTIGSILKVSKEVFPPCYSLARVPHAGNNLPKIAPGQLYLRGGTREPDYQELRRKSEEFWLPIINRLNEQTAVWEPHLREIIELEASGEWTRLEPGEPEEDEDDVDIADVYSALGKTHPDVGPFGLSRRSSGSRDMEQRSAASDLAKSMGSHDSNSTDIDSKWWDMVDRQELDRQEVLAFLEESTCEGEGRYSGLGQRFGGKRHRNRAMYLDDQETDEQMIQRHFFAEETNETAALLHKLEVAASYDDFQEIENLILNHNVDVNGLIDTLGEERAIHFAAWHDCRAAARKLILLGADPNAKNYYNQTAVHRAACNGALGVIQDLVQAGADPMAVDAYNFTPGDWAAITHQNQTCQWLFARFVHPGGAARSPLGPPPHYGLPENAGFEHFSPYRKGEPEPELTFFRDSLLADGDARWVDPLTDEQMEQRVAHKAWENDQLRRQEEMAEARDAEIAEFRGRRMEELKQRRRQMILGPGG